MNLLIHPEASADIREEAEYYEARQAGLGLAFLQEVDSAIESIMAMPKAFPERRKNIRMFVLPRFLSLCFIVSMIMKIALRCW